MALVRGSDRLLPVPSRLRNSMLRVPEREGPEGRPASRKGRLTLDASARFAQRYSRSAARQYPKSVAVMRLPTGTCDVSKRHGRGVARGYGACRGQCRLSNEMSGLTGCWSAAHLRPCCVINTQTHSQLVTDGAAWPPPRPDPGRRGAVMPAAVGACRAVTRTCCGPTTSCAKPGIGLSSLQRAVLQRRRNCRPCVAGKASPSPSCWRCRAWPAPRRPVPPGPAAPSASSSPSASAARPMSRRAPWRSRCRRRSASPW